MERVAILSKRQLGRLRKYISQIQSDELRDYLAEAERCLSAEAPRGALVLAWSALVYYLRQTILRVGFDTFRRAIEKRLKNWDSEKVKDLSPKNWDDGRLKDWELLQACEEMGIIGEAERKKLQKYAELRNDCAHPSQALVFPGDVISLFEYMFQHTSVMALDGWTLSILFFEQLLVDSDYDLDSRRVEGLMELLNKKKHLPLVSKLLDWYRDPYRLIKEEDDLRREEVATLARQRVPVLWAALANKLDSTEKAKANAQVAKVLPHVRAPELPEWRGFVFWDQWEQTSARARKSITTNLFSAFRMLIDAQQISPADLSSLEMMVRYADDKDIKDCQDLLSEAQRVVSTE